MSLESGVGVNVVVGRVNRGVEGLSLVCEVEVLYGYVPCATDVCEEVGEGFVGLE